jgi:hypothetical protein
MKRPLNTKTGPLAGLLLVAGLIPFAACDAFEPTWFGLQEFTVLYSLSRDEFIGRESAYDFVGQRPVIVERPKGQDPFDFDIAVAEIGGVFHALPAGLFDGFTIEPGVAVDSSGILFEDMTRAPRDGYVTDAPIVLREGWIYAVRTRRDFRGCNMYGKFEVVELDPAGTVEIRSLRNPLCNDRNLVPPES